MPISGLTPPPQQTMQSGSDFVSGPISLTPPTMTRESYDEASRRALQEPLTFNAGERAAYVKSTISKIMDYKAEGLTTPEIRARVTEFAEQYKHLFDMVTSPDGYDKKNLDVMLTMLDHMNNGNLNQHNASVIVGKRLYEKYGKKE